MGDRKKQALVFICKQTSKNHIDKFSSFQQIKGKIMSFLSFLDEHFPEMSEEEKQALKMEAFNLPLQPYESTQLRDFYENVQNLH